MSKNNNEKEKSRAEVIIHEIECGGFAACELEDIIDAATKELERVENEQ